MIFTKVYILSALVGFISRIQAINLFFYSLKNEFLRKKYVKSDFLF